MKPQPRLQGPLSLAQMVRVRGFTENEGQKSDAKGADAGKRRERKRPWYRLLKNIQNLDIFLCERVRCFSEVRAKQVLEEEALANLSDVR